MTKLSRIVFVAVTVLSLILSFCLWGHVSSLPKVSEIGKIVNNKQKIKNCHEFLEIVKNSEIVHEKFQKLLKSMISNFEMSSL